MAARVPLSRARAAARMAAVQALYQREMEGTDVEALIAEFHAHRLDEPRGRKHFDALVRGAAARQAELDAMIAKRLEGWTLDRLDRPMRALLRAAVFELAQDQAPPDAISSWVDIARAFCDEKQSGFVNALLAKVK